MCAAESVNYEEALAGKLLLGKFLDCLPSAYGHLVVVVGITFGSPPDFAGCTFLGGVVVNDVLVFRGTAGVYAGHDVDGTKLGYLSLVKAFKAGFGFLVVENFVRGVVKDFLDARDAVLFEIDIGHKIYWFLKIFI